MIKKATIRAKSRNTTLLRYVMWYAWNHLMILMIALMPGCLCAPLHRLRGVNIGKGTYVSRGAYIDIVRPDMVTIGRNSNIAYGAVILAHNREGTTEIMDNTKEVKIGNGVMVGVNAIVLPGVSISDGTLVPAGRIVRRDM